jgi:hypothetical protein
VRSLLHLLAYGMMKLTISEVRKYRVGRETSELNEIPQQFIVYQDEEEQEVNQSRARSPRTEQKNALDVDKDIMDVTLSTVILFTVSYPLV